MKYIWLTMVLGLCAVSCTSDSGGGTTVERNGYNPARPPLVKGQFPNVQSAYCGHSGSGGHQLIIWIFDSTGAPLSQFTIKALKKPYSILANVAYYSTDQNGEAKVSYQGCDSLELANLSFLNKHACRISTGNLPDTIVLTLSITQDRFIPTTM